MKSYRCLYLRLSVVRIIRLILMCMQIRERRLRQCTVFGYNRSGGHSTWMQLHFTRLYSGLCLLMLVFRAEPYLVLDYANALPRIQLLSQG